MNLSPIFARITKIDEERREVTGRATQEIVDRDGELMDYASTKPEFMKWSAEISADTGGKSLGNVRSMHGNVAAGKLTAIDFNDVEKAIDVTAKIIDDNEWEKCLEGVHTGFSIGGRYARKWAEPINGKMVQRYTAVPSEISIVDRPCCSSAKFFSIHKRDGSVEKRMFASAIEFVDGKIMLKSTKAVRHKFDLATMVKRGDEDCDSATMKANDATATAEFSGSKEDHQDAAGKHDKASALHRKAASDASAAGDVKAQRKHKLAAMQHEKQSVAHNDTCDALKSDEPLFTKAELATIIKRLV